MQSHETVIHAGRLLVTPGEAPKRGQSVWIADGKIKSVASGFIDPPTGARPNQAGSQPPPFGR